MDLAGQKFGRWAVSSRAENDKRGSARWQVVCDCGTMRAVDQRSLVSGKSTSCGCYQREVAGTNNRRHGHSYNRTRTYAAWQAMIHRCTNSKASYFNLYGGRGITVCDRWTMFENFLADMGEVPGGMTLERKDVNGNYEPSNCVWATWEEQAYNRRGQKKYLVDGEWRGIKQLMTHWGLSDYSVRKRVKYHPSKIIGE